MSLPGWYPDPAGAPNRFRYWDGQNWSNQTTADPAAIPPPGNAGGPSTAGGPGKGRRRLVGPLVVALVTLVVLVLAGVLVVRSLVGERPTSDPGPLPSSTVAGRDDSSPTALPETATPTPSLTQPTPTPVPIPAPPQSPQTTDEQPLQPCPTGDPTARQDHPADGRIHGGGLSFPRVAGWRTAPGTAFSWAYDVGEQMKLAESPSWYANLAVGALFTGDGFDEPRRSAELVMQCMITSGLYPYFTDRQDIWSKATTVDGHPAWSVRADVLIEDPDLKAKGDTIEVIVVDTGSPESLSMFVGAANIGDRRLQATINSTIEGLQVE